MKTLFLCRGNVARSQMAQAYFEKFNTNPDDTAISAGTKLSGPEQTIGSLQPKTDIPIQAMEEVGLDIASRTRKQVTL